MKELRRGCKFDHISSPPPPPAATSNPSGQTYEFESRRPIEEAIMEALRDNEVNILGICGMGGVGKTTMAKRIVKRVMDERLFDEAVITSVGQQLDKMKIQCEISQLLGLKLEAETLSARKHQLGLRLNGNKRILIVVDDIWEPFELKEVIGIPCESAVEGHCRVLLTSRDMDALKHMDVQDQDVYPIPTLSEEEARTPFIEKSGICSDDFNPLSMAEDIAKECKGLPRALTAVASTLKDKKDKRVWEGALQQLKRADPIDMPYVLKEVYNPLKLSYDFLDSPHARSLFLLCCLFPEDSDISVTSLTLYCMGLHNFGGNKTLEEIRNDVVMVIDMLKSRFLLLDGSIPHLCVRMHDVVRDVAIFIASKEGLVDANLHSRGRNSHSECKWISLLPEEDSQQIPITMGLKCPNLCILKMHSLPIVFG